ncbi:MAG: hypothetical protein H6631_10955 [Anaerolineaceae bacterium]|nr:hypothetical protein [Anaerolineaceae bacterium]
MFKQSYHQSIRGIGQTPRKILLGLAMLMLLLAVSSSLALAQDNVFNQPAKNYELVQGWYQGRETFYYDFGPNTPLTEDGGGVVTAPIYVLVTGFDADGNPQAVKGQANIVDVIPGDEGYSDLWDVTFVTVPADYQANTITSAQDVIDGGYEQKKAGVYVNCPIVPAGSTLSDGGAPLVQGWYKGQEVYYFDFGPNPTTPAPIYVLVTGFDADGNPQAVSGQSNIVDVIPGDEGYSAFWSVNFVTVPADYQANTITNAADILAGGYDIKPAGLAVNCPVIRTDEAMMTEGDDAMMAEDDAKMTDDKAMMDEGDKAMASDDAMMADETPAALPATGGVKSGLPLWSIIIAAGTVLAGLGVYLRRRNVEKSL